MRMLTGLSPERITAAFHSPRTALHAVFLICGVFFVFLFWAAVAHVEEVTRGSGRIIPSKQMQVVQAPERGIVTHVLFQEGAIVEQGAVLVQLDNTGFTSQLGELRQKERALLARVARLTAEAYGADLSLQDADAQTDLAVFLRRELEVYTARQSQLVAELAVLRSQLTQKQQDVAELDAQARMLAQNLALLARELEINTQLYKRKVMPEIEYLRLKREHTKLAGEQQMTAASLARARAALQEAQQRIHSARSTFATQAQADLAEAKTELAVTQESLRGANDRVDRSALTAPVRGIINTLHVSTLGAVVQAGEPLVEIVPLEDTLLVEARITPQDIAFLHPGQDVTVKITAYDYSVYGGLKGTLERISADTREDERGQPYFQVIIRTLENQLGSGATSLPIVPGMTASIDVLIGKKSVLSYIAKPLLKIKGEALRER